jgi:hypothetical protein
MPASAKYGFLLGLLYAFLLDVFPRPIGSVIVWTEIAIQAAVVELIVWRRLRLRWFALGGVVGLLTSVAMIFISARGLDLVTVVGILPVPAVIAVWTGLLFVPLSLGLEAARNSEEWRAWSEQTKNASLIDMLTLRHIPDLHSRPTP